MVYDPKTANMDERWVNYKRLVCDGVVTDPDILYVLERAFYAGAFSLMQQINLGGDASEAFKQVEDKLKEFNDDASQSN